MDKQKNISQSASALALTERIMERGCHARYSIWSAALLLRH